LEQSIRRRIAFGFAGYLENSPLSLSKTPAFTTSSKAVKTFWQSSEENPVRSATPARMPL
jgi:hypothetical protein